MRRSPRAAAAARSASPRPRRKAPPAPAHVSRLPRLFPLLALLSLFRDVTVSLLRLILHGAALLPRLLLRRPPAGDAGSVEFFEGTVTHTRHSPVFHSFTYPVRNVLVDLDRQPDWFSRQKPDCLSADEARALARTTGRVRLLTYAPSGGYQQNPISVYYCEEGQSEARGRRGARGGPPPLRTALAEVTNTPWGERVRFAFTLGSDVVPKPMHVSPFFPMPLQWRIITSPPADAISLSFTTFEAGGGGGAAGAAGAAGEAGATGALFCASLKLHRVPPPRGPPEAWAWLMPHRVALWIYVQALRLLLKGVPFLPHPKYAVGEGYRREAEEAESALERARSGGLGCPVFSYREAAGRPWSWS